MAKESQGLELQREEASRVAQGLVYTGKYAWRYTKRSTARQALYSSQPYTQFWALSPVGRCSLPLADEN